MQIHEVSQHNTKFWVLDEVYADFKAAWFDDVQSVQAHSSDDWQSGRQATRRLNRAGIPMVLRHYWRGGVPAHMTKDSFIFSSYRSSRCYQELSLLTVMRQLDLPVPEPIAARCQRRGLLYKADILMREIPNTSTLAQKLVQAPLDDRLWENIGKLIRRFHESGIQHVDLNANNILIDNSGNIFLIDFDRCKQKPYAKHWAQAGLQRLERSLQKEKSSNPQMHYADKMFLLLKQAYAV